MIVKTWLPAGLPACAVARCVPYIALQALSVLLAALCVCMPAAAEDTLLKLQGSGRITLGSGDPAAPTSYIDGEAQVGYHMDICKRIVQALKRRFDMPQLKVVTVPTTSATRYAMLNNGTTDIDCGHNPVNGAGMQQALFAHATLVTNLRAMTIVENAALALNNLDGRSVGMVVGTTAPTLMRSLARKSQTKFTETLSRSNTDNFSLLESGRVDLIVLPEPYLLSQRAQSSTPERYRLLDGDLRSEAVALIFRLNDEPLVAVANEVIDAMMRTGEMERLYRKWFVDPAPGLKDGLALPPPPALRSLFANPGSEMQQL